MSTAMADPTALEVHAAWTLALAFAISLAYELWRATARAGTSRHDSMRTFLTQDLLLYLLATPVIGLLLIGFNGAEWIGLAFSGGLILVSIFYYNPKIMLEREPALIDWTEDLVYTGLLFVAAALLVYETYGRSLA